MRQIGVAERAIELMCKRATKRIAFGKPLADNDITLERIAESRIEIDQARLLHLHGGGGVSQEFPLASMWAHSRTLRFADGPDEVHRRQIGRLELRKHS